MTFKRMDQATSEDWKVIAEEVKKRQLGMPKMIKSMLLELEKQVDGNAINQLQHALQTATRAFRAGASEETVIAALCHDIGKAISNYNHPAIGAEILRPYVSKDTFELLRYHQDFQGRFYYGFFGEDTNLRVNHTGKPWYDLACRFSDEWDQASFDPGYDTLPLSHFEPLIDKIFEMPLRWKAKAKAAA